jgi:hypothetical protein
VDRAYSTNWEERKAYRLLLGQPQVKAQQWHIQVDKVKTNIGENEFGDMVWMVWLRTTANGDLL